MRRALIGVFVLSAALGVVRPAFGGIAEIRDGHGHLVASAGRGQFASLNDSGWTLRIDSASRSARGVSLRGVSIAGGTLLGIKELGERGWWTAESTSRRPQLEDCHRTRERE